MLLRVMSDIKSLLLKAASSFSRFLEEIVEASIKGIVDTCLNSNKAKMKHIDTWT